MFWLNIQTRQWFTVHLFWDKELTIHIYESCSILEIDLAVNLEFELQKKKTTNKSVN